MKSIFVVGAGLHQVSGITVAKALGVRVFSIDSRPCAPGHFASSLPIVASPQLVLKFFEFLKVIKVLKKLPSLVTFGSEIGLELIGSLQDSRFVDCTTNKSHFRGIQKELNLPRPQSFLMEDRTTSFRSLPFGGERALVVKPNKSSGSRGVGLASGLRNLLLRECVSRASHYSRDRKVIVEEYLRGDEIGGQAFICSGKIASLIISDKLRAGWYTIGHTSPSKHEHESIVSSVGEQLLAICSFLSFENGPVNFDAIVSGSTVTLLEIAFRTSGNGLCEVGAARSGFDFESATTMLEVQPPCSTLPATKTEVSERRGHTWQFTTSLLLRSSKNIWVSNSRLKIKPSDRYKIESLKLKKGLGRSWESVGDEIGYVVLSHNEPIEEIEREIFAEVGPLLLGLK